MIYRVLVNYWRAETSLLLIKPWLLGLQRSGKYDPILNPIRKKFESGVTIDDYVQNFAACYLMNLHTHNRVVTGNNNALDVSESYIRATSLTKLG